MIIKTKLPVITISLVAFALIGSLGCSAPLSTREKGGLIGAGLGAGTGAIIGSTVGHAGTGALIGGPVGLIGGALIGDQLMGQEQKQQEQQQQLEQSRAELERQRQELESLKREESEYASIKGGNHPPYFLPNEQRIIREFFYGYSGLPPGLAKRRGNLPPGLQRQLKRNGTLPPGLQKRLRPLPFDLENQLSSIPAIWRRVILGAHIILQDRRTGKILDLIENVVSG